jgi:N4-bis(aminopropyl)spermidine synthase
LQLDIDQTAEQVADAVDLREGKEGVWAVLSTVARHAPVAVRDISRRTGLPVPVVAAICGELRKHGLLDGTRPARLSASAAQLPALRSVPANPALGEIAPRLTEIAEAAPSVDVAIDQSHCTVETKLRRATYLLEETTAARSGLLLLGDDDLTSVAVTLVAQQFGLSVPIAVLDLDERVIEFISGHVPDADCRVHDLREPLPDDLLGSFGVVMTDPPYTVEGGALFVARAVSALRPGAGGELLLCFGPKDHADSLELYRRMTGMGLYPRAVVRNFSEYVGAGVLGGVSHLHHLVTGTAERVAPPAAAAPGPIYTGELAPPARDYECTRCGAVRRVGRGARFRTVAELKASGCGDGCESTSFRPRARAAR